MMTPIAAVLFDMDDTLVRTSPIWTHAETTLLRRLGTDWSPELSSRYKGMNALDVARVIHETLKPALPLAECQQIMRSTLLEGFAGPLEPMPGAVKLVTRFRGKRRMAVASGSPLKAIETAMTRLGLLDALERIVTSESVARGKPHPDVFLHAAELLKVKPAECLVFEDSLIGCQAARAAGMRCLVVPSSSPEPMRSVATRVLGSLEEVTDAMLTEVAALPPP